MDEKTIAVLKKKVLNLVCKIKKWLVPVFIPI